MDNNSMHFEEALAKLKEMSEKIKSPDISLEDSIRCYKDGARYYEICQKILKEAKQKIETIEIE